MNATVLAHEPVETAARNLQNVADAAGRGEWAFAVGFAGTAHGLLHGTDAQEPLERLRDLLVDRIRMGEGTVPTGALEDAHIAARRAVGTLLNEAE